VLHLVWSLGELLVRSRPIETTRALFEPPIEQDFEIDLVSDVSTPSELSIASV